MRITTTDGRTLGHVTLTGDDIGALARGVGDDIERRTRALIADARRASITGGPAAGAPVPAGRSDVTPAGEGAPRRRRRWWPWLVLALLGFGIIGALSDSDDDAGKNWTPPAATVAPQETNALRATVSADGSIVIGGTEVDNVYRLDSPLRQRFADVIKSHGVTGVSGSLLDANLRDGVTFCRALAHGDVTAQRHAEVVTGIADEATAYGVGKQRRAVVTAALSALCPAL
ncbi:membrane protein [Gordonia phage Pleakley]|uniref:Uncharacterized protein n=1 Tax=Gordonia phage Pleakley TaxID=2283246 RepID=A0A345M6K9_9CAUD|nr:membrane protein [Gordonia phage Pleakley]AXH49816.1 hypothetical protein SEA_FURY_91 [Gordonia phage Fury]AXH66130.1 hypothetical protein SEA_PLEAKLEY_91 [Gordonia phage Pleakley]